MARKRTRDAKTGALLIDKPKGITSHDVVKLVRRAFGQREVGHTGTLDPMATGLMVVMLGRATKLARFVESADKGYDGTVVLGRSTTTYDAEGDTVKEAEVAPLSDELIEKAISGLMGTIEQEVPAFSAVKVDGERLYAKARRGEEFERPKRAVTIFEFSATRVALPAIDIRARVSKGTYIRTLAVQLGDALGLPAHLSMLRRTSVGRFSLKDAVTVDLLEEKGKDAKLMSMREALAHLPELVLDEGAVKDVMHGRPLKVGQLPQDLKEGLLEDQPVSLVDSQGEVVAVAHLLASQAELLAKEKSARALRYACVLVSPPTSRMVG